MKRIRVPATGGTLSGEEYSVRAYRLGEYEVKVALTPDMKFVGVLEVSVDRDFRSHDQRLRSIGVHDVSEFYKDE